MAFPSAYQTITITEQGGADGTITIVNSRTPNNDSVIRKNNILGIEPFFQSPVTGGLGKQTASYGPTTDASRSKCICVLKLSNGTDIQIEAQMTTDATWNDGTQGQLNQMVQDIRAMLIA